jgi:hypothetical protein
MKKSIFKLTALLSFVWLIPNCANFNTSEFGFIYTSVKFPNQNFKIKAIPSNTSLISVEITGKGLSESIKFTLSKDNSSRVIQQVPAGEKQVLAIAKDSDNKKLAEGIGNINVIAGKNNLLEITLKEVSEKETSSSGSNQSSENEVTENESPEDEVSEEVSEEDSENDPNEANETPEDEVDEEVAEEAAEDDLSEDGSGSSGSSPKIHTSITINEGLLYSPNVISISTPTSFPTRTPTPTPSSTPSI